MNAPLQTILIVEDDRDIRRLVGELLGREGFAVEAAEDAAAMDAVLGRLRPDLVILDLMLPGEDGLSICRRLRRTDRNRPSRDRRYIAPGPSRGGWKAMADFSRPLA